MSFHVHVLILDAPAEIKFEADTEKGALARVRDIIEDYDTQEAEFTIYDHVGEPIYYGDIDMWDEDGWTEYDLDNLKWRFGTVKNHLALDDHTAFLLGELKWSGARECLYAPAITEIGEPIDVFIWTNRGRIDHISLVDLPEDAITRSLVMVSDKRFPSDESLIPDEYDEWWMDEDDEDL